MPSVKVRGFGPKILAGRIFAYRNEEYVTAPLVVKGTNLNNLTYFLSNDNGGTWKQLVPSYNSDNTQMTGEMDFDSVASTGIRYRIVGLNATIVEVQDSYT